MQQPGNTARDDEPSRSSREGSVVSGGHVSSGTSARWPRELWDFALKTTDGRLARLCPFCADDWSTLMILEGVGSIRVPVHYNARSFTIAVPESVPESTVTWDPCGHAVVVEGRLYEPQRKDVPSCPT